MEQPEKINETAVNILKKSLENSGIDTSKWGKGQAKTLADLQKEIEGGETLLVNNESGELLRKITVSDADIYFLSPEGKKYRLKEEKQVFKDGRERRRNLGITVSEKMKPDEDPKNTMIRGIQEELGIRGNIALTKVGMKDEIKTSPSYPGLQTQYVIYKFQALLNVEQFNPNGYIEEQDGLSTYFVWEEMSK
jgi:hypothetical protein